MALDDYRRKRDFARSPEPRGGASRARAARQRTGTFCVHKHLARQLHYDVRLEYNGVLCSWAVPKGPSLDPTVRRLAVHVEDHPLDYGTFEGVIREGYGAGIVMLWDCGCWRPEADDVDAALRTGNLKFTLDGYKLKGSWALVRTARLSRPGRVADERNWLLIKHRDEWSGPLDITTFAPRSVKTRRDFEAILAADMPAGWISNRPVRGGAAGALLAEVIERVVRRHTRRPRRRPRAPVRATPPGAARPRTAAVRRHSRSSPRGK